MMISSLRPVRRSLLVPVPFHLSLCETELIVELLVLDVATVRLTERRCCVQTLLSLKNMDFDHALIVTDVVTFRLTCMGMVLS